MDVNENLPFNENLTKELSNEEERDILAQNITFFRKKLNISQTELAKRIQYSNKNVSKWERAETTPDIFTLKKLAKIFGVSIDTLLNPIADDTKTAIKTKITVPIRWKVYMLLLANAILIMGACIAFFILKSLDITSFKISNLFVYILPAMDISVFIFICCVKRKVDPISLSLFGWLLVTCFYISFIKANHIEYVYIIAIGYQIIAPIFAALINSGKIIKINKVFLNIFKKENSKKTEIKNKSSN